MHIMGYYYRWHYQYIILRLGIPTLITYYSLVISYWGNSGLHVIIEKR